MQTTGVDKAERRTVLMPLPVVEELPREMAEPQKNVYDGYGDEFVRRRSALMGYKYALPVALLLWILVAGLLWVFAR